MANEEAKTNSNSNSAPSTPTKKHRKYHHAMVQYNYHSPIIKKAVQSPLNSKENCEPSQFKYYPILSYYQVCFYFFDM